MTEAVTKAVEGAGPVAVILSAGLSGLGVVCGVLWRKLSVVEGKLDACQKGRLDDMRETLKHARLID